MRDFYDTSNPIPSALALKIHFCGVTYHGTSYLLNDDIVATDRTASTAPGICPTLSIHSHPRYLLQPTVPAKHRAKIDFFLVFHFHQLLLTDMLLVEPVSGTELEFYSMASTGLQSILGIACPIEQDKEIPRRLANKQWPGRERLLTVQSLVLSHPNV